MNRGEQGCLLVPQKVGVDIRARALETLEPLKDFKQGVDLFLAVSPGSHVGAGLEQHQESNWGNQLRGFCKQERENSGQSKVMEEEATD